MRSAENSSSINNWNNVKSSPYDSGKKFCKYATLACSCSKCKKVVGSTRVLFILTNVDLVAVRTFFEQLAMSDFGTVGYWNLVADKQQNVYIKACSGVSLGKIFSWGRGAQKVLFPFKLFLELAVGGRFVKLLELSSLKNLPVNIGEEQKEVFQHFKLIILGYFVVSIL